MTFHRILEAKARAYGVPLVFVDPKGHIKDLPDMRGLPKGAGKGVPLLWAIKTLCSSD
jgi:hypothetical protein